MRSLMLQRYMVGTIYYEYEPASGAREANVSVVTTERKHAAKPTEPWPTVIALFR